ncbi:MAG: POTRA domain-containing protein [Pirellulaceae bacterium]
MLVVSKSVGGGLAVAAVLFASVLLGLAPIASAQFGGGSGGMGQGPPMGSRPEDPVDFSARHHGAQFETIGEQIPVVEVEIKGNQSVKRNKVESYLKTRVGRTFDPFVLETDASALWASGLFRDVRTFTRRTPAGMVVTFEVFERPTVRHVKFVGNRAITDKALKKQADLEVGGSLDVYAVEEARRKIEEYYHSKGYSKTQVSILEGDRLQDRGVVLAISEGPQQRIWSVDFIGNTIASDGRLETQVQSRPGILKYFLRGEVNESKIDEDVQRLTNYYHSLGFFGVRVGRELKYNDSGDWAYLTFIIDEGPRYKVRSVSVLGNKIYSTEDLQSQLQLKPGEYFNQARMLADETTLRDAYGGQGYIFADIQAKPRFLWDSGQLDVVYDILEGEQWRVGRININIGGEYSHTRLNVVRNRISLRPGDIIDMREVRDSERRLKASQLFLNEPARGIEPRISVRPPELGTLESIAQQSGNTYRGQSPDSGDRSLRPGSLAALAADRPVVYVAGVQIAGCHQTSPAWIESLLRTRPGRYYDNVKLDADYDCLMRTGRFDSVRIYTDKTPEGVVVTFEVQERGRSAPSQAYSQRPAGGLQASTPTTSLKPAVVRRADVNVYAPQVAP